MLFSVTFFGTPTKCLLNLSIQPQPPPPEHNHHKFMGRKNVSNNGTSSTSLDKLFLFQCLIAHIIEQKFIHIQSKSLLFYFETISPWTIKQNRVQTSCWAGLPAQQAVLNPAVSFLMQGMDLNCFRLRNACYRVEIILEAKSHVSGNVQKFITFKIKRRKDVIRRQIFSLAQLIILLFFDSSFRSWIAWDGGKWFLATNLVWSFF